MMPWSKLPRSLRGDWRLTQRSPLALAAFLIAWLAADDLGTIHPVGAVTAREALVAQLLTHRPGDRTWAWEAVGECITAGLLVESEDGLALHLADWIHDGSAERVEPANTVRQPAGAADRRPGRPAKGSAPMTPRERRVRFAFAHRAWAMFRDVAPGTAWEAWAESHPVEASELLRDRNEARERNPEGGNETTGTGTKPGNETRERNPVGGRADSETSDPSESPDGENRAEKSESPDARGRERNSGTKLGNETHGAGNGTAPPRASLRTVDHPSAEERFGFDPLEILGRMDAASGHHLLLSLCSGDAAMAFGRLAHSLIERRQTTVEGLVRAAGHAPHDAWVSAQGKLPLHRLMASDGKILLDLIAGAATCPKCGGAPMTPPSPARTRAGTPSVREALSRQGAPAPAPSPKEPPRAR